MKKVPVFIICLILATNGFIFASGRNGLSNQTGYAEFSMPAGLNASDYLPNTIVFKVKPEFRNFCEGGSVNLPLVNNILNHLGKKALFKMFPRALPPATLKNEAGLAYADLSLIYEFEYSGKMSLVKAINSLLSTGQLLYAEPKYVPKVVYTPNDPSLSQQYFLSKIQAYSAWNISKGDTSVIIGITDTGTDPNHPDLEANLKHNYSDPVNGSDDDGDTYIDNFSGWDLGENDNDPSVGSCATCSHGSHVSGCAAAVTDNNIGVASPGFYSKFLPVKIADANGALTKAYEGIVYCADHGCQIINCSWGGGGGSQVGQDAITYATINKNALVVTAAGNNASALDFYPANYQYALSIASTTSSDSKSSFSNFGYMIDVCAPGSSIYTTIFNNAYSQQSGTSMAAPVAAGAAAIVKSFYPSYNGLQVGEQLRATADNIDGNGGNTNYQKMLGKGRINLYRALTESHPSVTMINKLFTDNNDNTFVINDTISLVGDIINYLAPTGTLTATISTLSPYVTIVDNSTTAGVLATMGLYNNSTDPFKFVISPLAPLNANVLFRMDFTDGTYSDFLYFDLVVNVDYINVAVNEISTSVTSKGRIGYNTAGPGEGLGFDYKGAALMYEAGLMIGNNSGAVSDMVRGDPAATTDTDFQSAQVVHPVVPSIKSEKDLAGLFNDVPADVPLGLLVNHNFYVWSTPGNTRYVIFQYHIKNNGSSPLNSLYAGIYADFDIGIAAENIANTDAATKMGYCYHTATAGYYAGIKVLSPTPFFHFGTENDGSNGGINVNGGFTSAMKYQSLSTNHLTAGAGTGADVSNIVGTGPFALNPGDSITVAFAMIAADDLNDLINSANNAQVKYDGITAIEDHFPSQSEMNIGSVYPNPADLTASVSVFSNRDKLVSIRIVDALGRIVFTSLNIRINQGGNLITIDTTPFNTGLYSLTIEDNGRSFVKRMTVSH